MSNAEDKRHPMRIERFYDVELLNLGVSSLLYLLSDKSITELFKDRELALAYKSNPTKAGYDELLSNLKTLKSPLATENAIPFAHGLFVILQTLFQQTSLSVKKAAEEDIKKDPDYMEKLCNSWMGHIARIVEDLATSGQHQHVTKTKEQEGITEL